MFLTFCHSLNTLGLSYFVAGIRKITAVFVPTTLRVYDQSAAGYYGWIDSPVGALAFIKDDGSLQWRW